MGATFFISLIGSGIGVLAVLVPIVGAILGGLVFNYFKSE
jgi:hypothetical protein